MHCSYLFRTLLLGGVLLAFAWALSFLFFEPEVARVNLLLLTIVATSSTILVWFFVVEPLASRLKKSGDQWQERLEVAVRAVNMGVWEWNVEAGELIWHGSMFHLYGLKPVDFGGTYESFLKLVHDDDRARVQREIKKSFERRGNFYSEFRVYGPFGKIKTIISESRGMYSSDGKVLRHVGVDWDVTEQREQELRSLHASKMSSLGEMSAGIAHEINNPLAIISAKAQTAREHLESSEIDPVFLGKQIQKIDETAMRIAQIVRGLRNFSRNGQNDRFQVVSVADLVDDTLMLCRSRLRERSIELRYNPIQVGPKENELTLECRGVEISQVLLNLINNAVDAVEPVPEKWIGLEVTDVGDFVEFQVSDSGPGVPKELRDKLMQPFFTTKEIGKGTGLGLSISLGIAHNHGGHLRYSDKSPHTTFVFILPKKQSSDALIESSETKVA